jgi:hypothetical protein
LVTCTNFGTLGSKTCKILHVEFCLLHPRAGPSALGATDSTGGPSLCCLVRVYSIHKAFFPLIFRHAKNIFDYSLDSVTNSPFKTLNTYHNVCNSSIALNVILSCKMHANTRYFSKTLVFGRISIVILMYLGTQLCMTLSYSRQRKFNRAVMHPVTRPHRHTNLNSGTSNEMGRKR